MSLHVASDASPEQGRKGAYVCEIRPGIDPDEHREHYRRSGGNRRGEKDEHGRQVVDDVGEHGSDDSDEEKRPERRRVRNEVACQRAQPVERDSLYDKPERQHEGQEWDVNGNTDIADLVRRRTIAGTARAIAPASATKAG